MRPVKTMSAHPPIDVLADEIQACRGQLDRIQARIHWLSHGNGFAEREERTQLRERFARTVAHYGRLCKAAWARHMATTQPEWMIGHYREMVRWADARLGSPRGSQPAWEALRNYRAHAQAIFWAAHEAWPDPDHLTAEHWATLRARASVGD
jgi:hypothetical protein